MSILLPKHIIPTGFGQGPHGVYEEFGEYGEHVENDILTCGHCQFTWRVIPGSGRKRGWCRRCNRPLCGKPSCMSGCRPFEVLVGLESPMRGIPLS